MRAISSRRLLGIAGLGVILALVLPWAMERRSSSSAAPTSTASAISFWCGVLVWSAAQWLPTNFVRRKHRSRQHGGRMALESLHQRVWATWESLEIDTDRGGVRLSSREQDLKLQVPVVDVQNHKDDIADYLETTYGKDWRRRPLLLRGLWTKEELADPNRRLSLNGLLEEPMEISYYTDATLPHALSPDAVAPISSIVANISRHGRPHKIGSQLLIQAHPELIREVAPSEIVTSLFGNYFHPESLLGSGPFRIFPSLTTVPLFVAWKRRPAPSNDEESESLAPSSLDASDSTRATIPVDAHDEGSAEAPDPYTALHCEPIGNVAVQLSGRKRWTLVDPSHWRLVRPHLSPDGRAFVASSLLNESVVPAYHVVTEAGDGLWVPTWTWHRVVYEASDEMAIGASLFHFRALDFVRNQPLFAFLILPALVLELVGYSTQ